MPGKQGFFGSFGGEGRALTKLANFRLLGDREAVDALTPTLDHIVIDRGEQVAEDARAIRLLRQRVPGAAFVNILPPFGSRALSSQTANGRRPKVVCEDRSHLSRIDGWGVVPGSSSIASLLPWLKRAKGSAAQASGSEHFGGDGELMGGVLPPARRANSHTEANGPR
jgi:hypothetical protein